MKYCLSQVQHDPGDGPTIGFLPEASIAEARSDYVTDYMIIFLSLYLSLSVTYLIYFISDPHPASNPPDPTPKKAAPERSQTGAVTRMPITSPIILKPAPAN